MRYFLCLLILGSLSACSPAMEEAGTKASGTITLDGEPLTGGVINFYPKGEGNSAFATINVDGTFTVNTSAGTTGLEPGEYTASISYDVEEREDAEGNPIPVTNPIPEKYRNEENPVIEISVPAGGDDNISITLTSDK